MVAIDFRCVEWKGVEGSMFTVLHLSMGTKEKMFEEKMFEKDYDKDRSDGLEFYFSAFYFCFL